MAVKTILVVEDEPAVAELLCELLLDEHYEVLAAAHGREALLRLAEKQADLVISDLMMPLLNGQELCQAMQADPRYRTIPIIIITAAAGSFTQQDCQFAALLNKPFDVDLLLSTVAQVLERSR